MRKTEALRIIHNCALSYKQNLAHKNLLFVTTQDTKTTCFETAFLPRNFLHLVGASTKLGSTEFYSMAIRGRLGEQDFGFMTDGTTEMKLNVLPQLMNIHISARMAGDYDFSKSLLVTDKLAGTVTAAMGFRKTGDKGIYVPNSALNTDLRLISIKPVQRIAAIFQKSKLDKKYTILTYIAKGLTIDDDVLSTMMRDKVDRQNLTATFSIPIKNPHD